MKCTKCGTEFLGDKCPQCGLAPVVDPKTDEVKGKEEPKPGEKPAEGPKTDTPVLPPLPVKPDTKNGEKPHFVRRDPPRGGGFDPNRRRDFEEGSGRDDRRPRPEGDKGDKPKDPEVGKGKDPEAEKPRSERPTKPEKPSKPDGCTAKCDIPAWVLPAVCGLGVLLAFVGMKFLG